MVEDDAKDRHLQLTSATFLPNQRLTHVELQQPTHRAWPCPTWLWLGLGWTEPKLTYPCRQRRSSITRSKKHESSRGQDEKAFNRLPRKHVNADFVRNRHPRLLVIPSPPISSAGVQWHVAHRERRPECIRRPFLSRSCWQGVP